MVKNKSHIRKEIAELLGDRDDMVIKVYNHILEEKEDAEAAINNALFSHTTPDFILQKQRNPRTYKELRCFPPFVKK